ncbi:ImmA/IrrE family metallo-endopeptidase [Oryzobacter sp. R7]|uniref:ImmA/IrrE family metallo-endopeptidase n=1 Tax=Oryzobacter faecalis TaxID=3388656 RepID=UPI00398D1D7B
MQGDDHHHPWRELRRQEHLTVAFVDLEPGVWGLTAGDWIYLDSRLLQVERRCTLAHELEHTRRGHQGCQPPAVEADVHRVVARRLIPFERLLIGLKWARDEVELADELWVDIDTLHARLDGLTDGERHLVDEAREHHHP